MNSSTRTFGVESVPHCMTNMPLKCRHGMKILTNGGAANPEYVQMDHGGTSVPAKILLATTIRHTEMNKEFLLEGLTPKGHEIN